MKCEEEPVKDDRGISRREFSRVVGLAAATVALPAGAAGKAPSVETRPPAGASMAAGPNAGPVTGEDTTLTPVAEAQVQIIFAKYGSRLNDEQKADVRRLIAAAQKGSDELHTFHLENSDEPAMIFAAKLAEE